MGQPIPPAQLKLELKTASYWPNGVPGTDIDMTDWYNNGAYNFQWASVGGNVGIAVPQSDFQAGDVASSIQWHPDYLSFFADPTNTDLINSAMWYMDGYQTGMTFDDFVNTYGGFFPTFASTWGMLGLTFDYYIDTYVNAADGSTQPYSAVTQQGSVSGSDVPLYLSGNTAAVVAPALPYQTWHNQNHVRALPDPDTLTFPTTFSDFLLNDASVPGSALVGANYSSADIQTANGWPTYYRNVTVTYPYWSLNAPPPPPHHNHIGGSIGIQTRDKGSWHPVNNLGL